MPSSQIQAERPDAPIFDAAFRDNFASLLAWRRDVRRFRVDPVPDALFDDLMALTSLSPSVGNSQPARFVRVEDAARRNAVIANFDAANAAALGDFAGERARLYAQLKLDGLREAPIHLAVFCDEDTEQGFGLGARTMPETRRYSAVCALHSFWLAARAYGLGVGWVSILAPESLAGALDVPAQWRFIAYLCVGWPQAIDDAPELERAGWQARVPQKALLR